MRVAFYTVFRKDPQHYVLAERLIASVRRTMPGVEIFHLTDEASPSMGSVNMTVRLPHGKMLQRRIEHYASLQGDWLLLDTDIVVQQDVRHVFDDPSFDVALCDRNWPHMAPTPALTAQQPYNTGVVFSRSPEFWQQVLSNWKSLPEDKQASWYSEQIAVAIAAQSWAGARAIKVLPGAVYNYPPQSADDPCEGAAIVHYKGQRKAWAASPVAMTVEDRNVPARVQQAADLLKPVVEEMRARSMTVDYLKDRIPHYAVKAQPFPETPSASTPIHVLQSYMPLRVFIGYDPRQPVSFHVAAHSVQTRASKPVAVTRLQLNQLPMTRRGLTEFTYSRYLVPYLSEYKGWSVFLDADMLMLGDIHKLVSLADPRAAVSVVKSHQRFEWASLMVFNNEKCGTLTPEFVDAPKTPLADLSWASLVGDLPKEWNHLVGYDTPNPSPKNIHFTAGIPVWPETKNCEHAEVWFKEWEAMLHSVSFAELMGGSVHKDLHNAALTR